ncbi:RNA polymerase sigma factor RpoE [hydrothermal vent metagenome]|uniref:RNA polymerase sigma factor RpoE n=1 Tax=hydrothermal vent metagenome TaxID=652676 RepID=A0A3B0VZM4_9ZZZZ
MNIKQDKHKDMSEKAIDLELVKQAQKGDIKAFELLVQRYQQKVGGVISKLIKDYHEIQDITQDVFIKVYKALPNFRGDSAFYTWIYRIAINTAKNHLVAKGRRIQNSDIEPVDAENYSGGFEQQNFDTPDAEYERQEIEKVVHDSIEGLPDDLKQAIMLREVDGLSYEEIAETMQCPIGTVRSRIFRARDAVDNALKPLLQQEYKRTNYVR